MNTPQPHPTQTNALKPWLGALLLLSLLLRLALALSYQPIAYSDTPSYRRLAQAVLDGFQRYDGTRTPGYPVFLALIGSDRQVWLVQMLLGVAITGLLFYIAWQLSGRAWLAGLVGLAHTLNLGQLFFEANLLTETLTTFWIALTLAGALLWLKFPTRRTPWLAAGLGTTASLALLTRPLFLYLPLLLLWPILLPPSPHPPLQPPGRASKARLLIPGLSFGLPVLLLVGGWIGFIHARFGDWALTTMTGYHLVQHTGNFFEYLPDEYAPLRDTYLAYRQAHIAQYGTQTNTIWEAIPAMSQVSGLHFYDLSRTLARLSLQLILAHPDLYLKNVLKGWWMFWWAPVYWQPTAFACQAIVPALRGLILAERLLLIGCNLLFLTFSLAIFLLATWRPSPRFQLPRPLVILRSEIAQLPPFFWLLTAVIWIASILQTLLDHGDNPRFLIPLQSMVVLWVIWASWRFFSQIRRGGANPETRGEALE